MKLLKNRFIIMGAALFVMMGLLIYQLGKLTIKEGETWSSQATQRSQRSVAIKGTRGRILDRNGVVLAYSETSFNVEFFRDPEKRSANDSALYTQSLIKAIRLIEEGGYKTIDTCYIVQNEEGELVYNFGVQSPAAYKQRYKNFLDAIGYTIPKSKQADVSLWPTAEEIYLYLRKSWKIPEDLSFEEARKVMSIRQEVLLNNYRAYQPVVIAYDVSMEVVAKIEMYKDELAGLQTAQSTRRIYPRGTVAAHIVGYLNRSVDSAVSPFTLISMGFTYEQIKDFIEQDEEGNEFVNMLKLGYDYSDMVGASGIELSMEAQLTGATTEHQGVNTIEVNKYGSKVRQLEFTLPTDGNDVMLTIDVVLQQVTEGALETVIEAIREKEERRIADHLDTYREETKSRANGVDDIKTAQTGAIVVMDVNSGQVLAMASSPSFDPNMFISGLTKEQSVELFESDYAQATTPMRNKAISLRAAPGSIFKMLTGLAGLMENAITLQDEIDCLYEYYLYDDNGEKIQSSRARCHSGLRTSLTKHQDQNLTRALINSCNYYFYTVAEKLGIDKIDEWSKELGLNALTGIELPGEAEGMIGGQAVLFDHTLPANQQKTSLPLLVKRGLMKLLTNILEYRNSEVDEEAVSRCADRLLELQDGSLDGKGDQIREILSKELQIPATISKEYSWTNDIASYLNELQWKPTLTIRSGIGQGVSLVTPVAVARYVSAIANRGTVYDVHIVDRIVNPEGKNVKVVEPSIYNQVEAPDAYWDAIMQGLGGVVSPEDGGTAAEAFSKEFIQAGYSAKLAGKTGTAQPGANYVDIENTSWFVTYLPKDKPEIAIVVCVPYGYSGSSSAIAIEKIAKYYFDSKDASAPETLVEVNGIVP